MRPSPIAVIGLSSIFAEAEDLTQFWLNIIQGRNCIRPVPPSRWNVADYYDPDPTRPDKIYSQYGGFIPDIEFQPGQYGLPPHLLDQTDSAQLIGLYLTTRLLDHAGYATADRFSDTLRQHTGVILGTTSGLKLGVEVGQRLAYPYWEKVMMAQGLPEAQARQISQAIRDGMRPWEENTFPGLLGNVIAGRIANRFNLGGTNCVVDAACAGALAALKMAVAELQSGQADLMISGGIDTENSPFGYMCFSKTPAFTSSDRVRTFDQNSDGMMVGEGGGLVLLKRLEDAERDGDTIYAVIRGIGSSSDGRFRSIYAPNANGQQRALARAYQQAGYTPDTVGLIEAHGTGTPAGDPEEVQAWHQLLQPHSSPEGGIALGSVKSQIGHTKAAAGMAGLIKATMALHHKVLPPTINVEQPASKLNLDDSPLYINSQYRPWFAHSAHPRRSGVSAFGFGGTNFHVALEEYQPALNQRSFRSSQPVLLAADTPAHLQAKVQELMTGLKAATDPAAGKRLLEAENQTSHPEALAAGAARLGFVYDTPAEALALLECAARQLASHPEAFRWQLAEGVVYQQAGLPQGCQTAALFSGQGSQYVAMANEAVCELPELRTCLEPFERLFAETHGYSLAGIMYPQPVFSAADRTQQQTRLTETHHAQPAIGAISAGLFALLQQAGFAPDQVAGHSFGELTALWAAGCCSLEDMARLATVRGAAMQAMSQNGQADHGTMLAVRGQTHQIEATLRNLSDVSVANYNAPDQVVLTGGTQAIETVKNELESRQFTTARLPVSAAFHSARVAHAQGPLAEATRQVDFQPPRIPVYANATATPYPQDSTAMAEMLVDQILQPVRFRQIIETMYQQGVRVFVEIGPRNVLAGLVEQTLGSKSDTVVVALNPNPQRNAYRQLMEAVVQLQTAGVPVGDPDRLAPPLPETREAEGMKFSVKISGENYQSEKLQQQQALATGETRTQPEPTPPEPVRLRPIWKPQFWATAPAQQRLDRAANRTHPAEQVPDWMRQVVSLQEEVLSVHRQHLEQHAEFLSGYYDLLERTTATLFRQLGREHPEVQATLDHLKQNLAQLTDYQRTTAQTHLEYMRSQAEQTRVLFREAADDVPEPTAQETADVVPMDTHTLPPVWETAPQQGASTEQDKPGSSVTPTDQPPETPSETPSEPRTIPARQTDASTDLPVMPEPVVLLTKLREIISEKTGYPADMLEGDMDMEADLGIDSIKKVEILGAVLEQYPELSLDQAQLATLRTLQEVVDYVVQPQTQAVASQKEPPAETPQPVDPPEASHIPAAAPTRTASPAPAASPDLLPLLKSIISEKTGYPADMLEGDMDMEADLGIDSIKKVEILGAVLEQYPELSLDQAQLATLRTLQEVVDYVTETLPQPAEKKKSDPGPRPHAWIPLNLPRLNVACPLLPKPDSWVDAYASGGRLLLVNFGVDWLPELQHALAGTGLESVVLSPAAGSRQRSSAEEIVPDSDPVAWPQVFQRLASTYGRFVGVACLFPETWPSGSESRAVSAQTLWPALAIAQQGKTLLQSDEHNSRKTFLTVVRTDGRFGTETTQPHKAYAASLAGLTKTLNQEWPDVFCRHLDLHPRLSDVEVSTLICDELYDPVHRYTEIGYDAHGQRRTLTAVPEPQTLAPGSRPPAETSTWLITGGGRGVTAACAIELARRYRCRLILTGRTPLTTPAPELEHLQTEAELQKTLIERQQALGQPVNLREIRARVRTLLAEREIQTTLSAIRGAGVEVEYHGVDVRDRQALSAWAARVQQRSGPITGLLHGAGVLADSLIEHKTQAEFDRVFGTKVEGLFHLLEAFPPAQLQHLVLFSSVAGCYGNAGQSDYALANEALNKTAYRLQHQFPELNVVAINWGPWAGGMVSPGLQKLMQQRNIPLIPLADGARFMAQELLAQRDQPQVVVGDSLAAVTPPESPRRRTYTFRCPLSEAANPFLRDHIIKGDAVMPLVTPAQWILNRCGDLFPGYHFRGWDDLRLMKGLRFDRTIRPEYGMIIRLNAHSPERLELQADIVSDGPAKYPLVHYRMDFRLFADPGFAPLSDDPVWQTPFPDFTDAIPGVEIYRNGTLFHGPLFHGLQKITGVSASGIWTELRLPALPPEAQGQFPVNRYNSYVTDCVVQMGAVWVRLVLDTATMPLRYFDCEYYQALTFDQTCIARMDITHCAHNLLRCRIWVWDDAHQPVMRLSGEFAQPLQEEFYKLKNIESFHPEWKAPV